MCIGIHGQVSYFGIILTECLTDLEPLENHLQNLKSEKTYKTLSNLFIPGTSITDHLLYATLSGCMHLQVCFQKSA